MQELIQRIQTAWTASRPFVAYHLPEAENVSCFFPEDTDLHYLQSYTQEGFIFSAFQPNSQPILFAEASSEVLKFEVAPYQTNTESEFSINDNQQEKENYLRLARKAIDEIKTGTAQKIVVSRKISTAYELNSPAELLLKLIAFYPKAFTYVWFHPEVGFWAGASPEVLAKTYRTQFKTMALAGTKRADETREWTPKELKEQQIVLDEIVNSLQALSDDVAISDRQTEQAGELLHLRTDISAKVQTSDFGKVLKQLHPTSAVCGLPKDQAYAFLKTHEMYNRQFYAGFFGELNMPQHYQRSNRTRNQEQQAYKSVVRASTLNVNLRCLSYSNGEVSLYVGGGLTKDSIPEDEWKETVNKSRTMLKVL